MYGAVMPFLRAVRALYAPRHATVHCLMTSWPWNSGFHQRRPPLSTKRLDRQSFRYDCWASLCNQFQCFSLGDVMWGVMGGSGWVGVGLWCERAAFSEMSISPHVIFLSLSLSHSRIISLQGTQKDSQIWSQLLICWPASPSSGWRYCSLHLWL